MAGRPLAPLELDSQDRATLERWTARRKTAGVGNGARIILGAA